MRNMFRKPGLARTESAGNYTPQMETLEARVCLSNTALGTSTAIAVADLNGDGSKDLISTRFGHSGGLNIRFNNGSGGFGAPVFPFGYQFARGAAVDIGDFNKDGHIDIVVFGGGGTGGGALYVLLNNGDGSFAAPVREGGDAVAGVANGALNDARLSVGDIDGDGNVDILVSDIALAYRRSTRSYSGQEVYVLFGNGDGTFENAVPASLA